MQANQASLTKKQWEIQDWKDFQSCQSEIQSKIKHSFEGIHGADSMIWKVYREPIILLAVPTAVFLQVAHSAVAAGVSAHSSYHLSLYRRSQRTLGAMYAFVFGSAEVAMATSYRLYDTHLRVYGTVEDPNTSWHNQEYRANNQALLKWVQATFMYTVTQIYEKFVSPLSAEDKQRLHEDHIRQAVATGLLVDTFPKKVEEFEQWFLNTLSDEEIKVGKNATVITETLLKNMPYPSNYVTTLFLGAFLPEKLRLGYNIKWTKKEQNAYKILEIIIKKAYGSIPLPYRYAVAYHQASKRIRDSYKVIHPNLSDNIPLQQQIENNVLNESLYSNLLDFINKIYQLPTAIRNP